MHHDPSDLHWLTQSLAHFSPLELAGFFSILSFSFFSSLHCLFMCGPLLCVSLKTSSPNFRRDRLYPLLAYNTARGLSYITMGALLGLLGESLVNWSSIAGKLLAFILAIFLLIVAYEGFRQITIIKFSHLPSFGLLAKLIKRQKDMPPALRPILLGGLTVLLPCISLTPTLTLAAASASSLSGAVVMLAFFLGTLPAMTLAFLIPPRIQEGLKIAKLHKYSYVFLLIAALLTMARSFGVGH